MTSELCEQTKPRRRIVHLVNYKPGAPTSDLKLEVCVPRAWKVRQVGLLSPESSQRRLLPFEQAGSRVRVTVPRLEVYALVSIEAE